jgi:uncharacterized protein YlxW (UPF0749 family)
MRRVLAVGVLFVLASASGCGSPDGTMRDAVASVNRLADAVEKGESEKRQEELAQKVKDAFAKFDQLKMSEEQKKALFEKHADELKKAMLRLDATRDGPNWKLGATPLYR